MDWWFQVLSALLFSSLMVVVSILIFNDEFGGMVENSGAGRLVLGIEELRGVLDFIGTYLYLWWIELEGDWGEYFVSFVNWNEIGVVIGKYSSGTVLMWVTSRGVSLIVSRVKFFFWAHSGHCNETFHFFTFLVLFTWQSNQNWSVS